MDASFTDNSHIIGIPFKIGQSDEIIMEIERTQARDIIPILSRLNMELNIIYKQEVADG